MSKKEDAILEEEARARRDFLKRAGAVGVTAPAVALLLSAAPNQVQAQTYFSTTTTPPTVI